MKLKVGQVWEHRDEKEIRTISKITNGVVSYTLNVRNNVTSHEASILTFTGRVNGERWVLNILQQFKNTIKRNHENTTF